MNGVFLFVQIIQGHGLKLLHFRGAELLSYDLLFAILAKKLEFLS